MYSTCPVSYVIHEISINQRSMPCLRPLFGPSLITRAFQQSLLHPSKLLLFPRCISTLEGHPHIYIHSHPKEPSTHFLSLLPTTPVTPSLSLGSTPILPPTLTTFTTNPQFLSLLHSTLSTYAKHDPSVHDAAVAFASSSLHSLWSRDRRAKPTGGWVHVTDQRSPPEWGRISDVEDILGSVQVDENGNIIEGYEPCFGYRVWTRNGIMQLSPYLRDKLVEVLLEEEKKIRAEKSHLDPEI